MHSGILLALSGPDGAGKDAHASRLAARLTAAGHAVLVTREPTHALAPADTDGLDWRGQALAYALDRRRHVARVVAPALARGEVVVCVRYALDGVAYALARAEFEGADGAITEGDRLCHLWALEGVDWLGGGEPIGCAPGIPVPALSLVFTASDQALDARIAGRGEDASAIDRDGNLQARVRQWFANVDRMQAGGWWTATVDTTGDAAGAADEVWRLVESVLAREGAR